MTRLLTIATLVLIASGCAFHTQPFMAYADRTHPLSDTSVFSTVAPGASNPLRNSPLITDIDGVPTSCIEAGCPIWVRVLPGDHTFTIRNYGEVKVSGMRQRHVYVARGQAIAGHAVVSVVDLGENPDYGFKVRDKYRRVAFE
jgi:hypothetical protein